MRFRWTGWWQGGSRTCAAASGWRRYGLARCHRRSRRCRSTGWLAVSCPAWVAGELCARAEGNPFFTEQLVAVALGNPGVAARLPARLADLLIARAGGCG